MNLFYNKEGIGDVLLISMMPVDRENMDTEKNGDVVRIFNSNNKQTFGFNIFHASKYFSLADYNGSVEPDQEMAERLNQLLKDHGFDDQVVYDPSPKFVVGFVKEKEKHPNADKLSVCHVDIGGEVLQIVCGAPNVDAGQKVVVAKTGAVMPNGLVIQPSELRGVPSNGMICSARELELPNATQQKGILVLDDEHHIGEPFPLP